jgi:Domain of unknown function (DUF6766)
VRPSQAYLPPVRWIRDRALFLAFVALFLGSWAGQLVAEWHEFAAQQQEHDSSASFWSGDFWWQFWSSTLENWQSEWLQLAAQVALPAYLVYKGASQSKDSDERIEAKVDWLVRNAGHDPQALEAQLEPDYQSHGEAQTRHTISVLAAVVVASLAVVVIVLAAHFSS